MDLSIIIPIHNEAPVLAELVRRTRAAAVVCGRSVEVVLVDDASSDETAALAPGLADEVVRFVRLTSQCGQTGATMRGLAQATGDVVVTLDGDLQDPPEHIPALVEALRGAEGAEVAFAVKREREEGALSRAVFGFYHWLQEAFGDASLPPGAGSYCAFRADARDALLAAPPSRANLATLLAQRGRPSVTAVYVKQSRQVGRSQVGAAGLVREAVDSLAATGALGRLARVGALGVTITVCAASTPHNAARHGLVAACAGLGFCLAAAARERRLGRGDPERP